MQGFKNSCNCFEDDYIPMRQFAVWSYEETVELLSMFDHGCSMQEICRELFRTPKGVAAKLVRLGRIERRKDVLILQKTGEIKGGLHHE